MNIYLGTFVVSKWIIDSAISTKALWHNVVDANNSKLEEVGKPAVDCNYHRYVVVGICFKLSLVCDIPGCLIYSIGLLIYGNIYIVFS